MSSLEEVLERLQTLRDNNSELRRLCREVRESLTVEYPSILDEMVAFADTLPKEYEKPVTYIYFIQAGDSGPIKIGKTRYIKKRLRSLQTINSEDLQVRGWMPEGDWTEKQLHQKFAVYKQKGEWFLPSEDILTFIQRETKPYSEASDR